MIKLFTEEEYKNSKPKDLLSIRCERCDKEFKRTKRQIQVYKSRIISNSCTTGKGRFCSHSCANGEPSQLVSCKQCGKEFSKRAFQIKQSPNHFCSHSCAATFSNTHKTTGTRRSKLEKYLEEQLTSLYSFPIKYNSKDEINSELDIYIPHLKLAFELNGIFHYEPVFGEDKLSKIQNNDNRKFQACIEKGISLCIIDTSSHKYVKPSTCKKYLDIICDIILKSL